jgi:hypothetical protein
MVPSSPVDVERGKIRAKRCIDPVASDFDLPDIFHEMRDGAVEIDPIAPSRIIMSAKVRGCNTVTQ